MELNPLNLMKGAILYKEYKIKKKFRNNNLLQVYLAENINTKELFFIKFEKKESNKKGLLETESYILNKVKSMGIPTIEQIGYYNPRTIISIQASLGLPLSEIFNKFYRCFNIKDITMIAIQILERIKFIHSKNIIYCNINPDNLYINFFRFQNIIYLTDFTHAIKCDNVNKTKNSFNSNNLIFSSINSMNGIKIYKKDDLESLGYLLLFLLKGGLPWELLAFNLDITNEEKTREIFQIKKYHPLDILYEGIPEEFKLYINYIKNLPVNHEIDYNYCFNLFYSVFKKNNIINDGIFSWYQEKRTNKNLIKDRIKSYFEFSKQKKFMQRKTSDNIALNKSKSFSNNNNKNSLTHLKKANSCCLNIYYKTYFNNDKSDINGHKNKKNSMTLSLEEKDYSIEGQIDQDIKMKTIGKRRIKKINLNLNLNRTINNCFGQKNENCQYKTKVNTNKKKISIFNIIKKYQQFFTDSSSKSIAKKEKEKVNLFKRHSSNRVLTYNTSLKKIKSNSKFISDLMIKTKTREKTKEIKEQKKIQNQTLKIKTESKKDINGIKKIKKVSKPNTKKNINLNNILRNNMFFSNFPEIKKNYSNTKIKSRTKDSNKFYTIINNSISQLNLVQNISNIYVAKTFFDKKSKKKYIKPNNYMTNTENNRSKLKNEKNIKNTILKINGNKEQEKIKKIETKKEKEKSFNDYYLIS